MTDPLRLHFIPAPPGRLQLQLPPFSFDNFCLQLRQTFAGFMDSQSRLSLWRDATDCLNVRPAPCPQAIPSVFIFSAKTFHLAPISFYKLAILNDEDQTPFRSLSRRSHHLHRARVFFSSTIAHEDPAEGRKRRFKTRLDTFRSEYRRAYMLPYPEPRSKEFLFKYPKPITEIVDKLEHFGTDKWQPGE